MGIKKAKKEIYYSKVMLFGEYSIILGSMGLTIPYAHFNGELKFINKTSYTDLDFAQNSNQQIRELNNYISDLKKNKQLLHDFNSEKLAKDLDDGLYFESSIPEGYGLGSSGALVAALYNEYTLDRIESRAGIKMSEMLELKKNFAQIESFYHGTSSGIDPLICYLKHPLVLENKNQISSVGIPRKDILDEDAIFLINSGKPGKTAPLVKLFMEKIKDSSFLKAIEDELIPMTNTCIENMLKGNLNTVFTILKQLSAFQLDKLPEMIPASFKEIWKYGLKSDDFTLKLCGSGGGGFILGFTRKYSTTKAYFNELGLEMIPVYREVIK
ncbi:mevalonate kinase family protein [Carboxylicivirga linearis]|uniref:Mevalonate kinase n=1 Tax=Carboxylicivirga linearis TaxID=1628157 RepID=A0ABS5K022_9BACT|nr:mevalonate kinase [Carboxylicivirga linearis]MBS2100476.1 mevalonate kinase [Carboxylicivirga linearis]